VNKSLNIDAIVSWEIGIIIIFTGVLLIFFGYRQSNKNNDDLNNLPYTKPTTKILFGSAFIIFGCIQLLPLLKNV